MGYQHDNKSNNLPACVGSFWFPSGAPANTVREVLFDSINCVNGLTLFPRIYNYEGTNTISYWLTKIEESDIEGGPFTDMPIDQFNGTLSDTLSFFKTEPAPFAIIYPIESIGVFSCKRYLSITITIITETLTGNKLSIGVDAITRPSLFPVVGGFATTF